MTLKEKTQAFINKYGNTVTVKHHTGNTYDDSAATNVSTYTSETAKAAVSRFDEKDVGGLIRSGDIEVMAILDTKPDKKAKVVIGSDTYSVIFVDTIVLDDEDIAYTIQARL